MDNSKTTRQILKTQIKRYIQAGIKPKILPFVYLATYLIFFPMFLYKLIPEKTENSFFSQQNIFHISLILGNTLTVLFYAISMYFVYTGKYQFLQKYRVNKKVLWPWEKDQKQWRQLLKKTITTLFFNCLVIGPLVLLIGSQFFQIKIIIYSEEIPSKFTIIWQFFLFMIVEDMTSTITHSQLHNSYLYFLHKKHHQYKTSISITAQYATPIQFVFSNSFPTIIGFLVLSNFYPVHLVSAITWLIFRILITSDVHFGYEWPWDPLILIPFSAPAPYHDFHHSHNVGNYGSSLMFWQAIFGTNKQYFKYIQQKQKQNKQNQKLC